MTMELSQKFVFKAYWIIFAAVLGSVFVVYVNATRHRSLHGGHVQHDTGNITFNIDSCQVSRGIMSADGWAALRDGEKISRVYLQNADNGHLFIMRSSIADDVAHIIKTRSGSAARFASSLDRMHYGDAINVIALAESGKYYGKGYVCNQR